MPESEKDPAEELRSANLTAEDALEVGLSDQQLKVVTMAQGPSASLRGEADVPFNDLEMACGVSDTGETVTLGDVEAAMVERVKKALANGTIFPRTSEGSSEIQ